MTLILGVETSCDDTSIAIYDGIHHKVLANVTYNQNVIHSAYGGIKPEIAARQHIIYISQALEQCLLQANKQMCDIDCIAYTTRPGLTNSLVIGATFAKTLSYACGLPSISINHIEGHILSPWLDHKMLLDPYLALVLSGGHTQIFVVSYPHYRLIGESLDDAVGEAFDKSAKVMGIPYPGGPYIEQWALKGSAGRFTLPLSMCKSNSLNLSFSGLKSALCRLWNSQEPKDDQARADLSCTLQDTISKILVKKILLASEITGIRNISISGGVISNQFLKKEFGKLEEDPHNLKMHYADQKYATDNAAMIAFAGYLRFTVGERDQDLTISVKSREDLSGYD